MKLITQFKNWILNVAEQKNTPTITIFVCITIILLLMTNSYKKEVKYLEKEMINQKEDFFNALDLQCADKVELINNLYDEVSDLGWKLDSMKLKYDE